MTLGAYATGWLRDRQNVVRPATADFYHHSLRRIEPIARKPLSAIDAQDVRDIISDGIERGLSTRTIRGTVQTLAMVLAQAEAEGLLARNVVKGVRLPKPDARPTVHYTAEQARRIIAAGQGDGLASLYAVAVCTALRRGELLALTWADVDLRARTLRVDRSKTRAGIRRIPLSEPALATFRSLPRSPGVIWPYHPSSVSHDFPDFCERNGLPVYTLHTLRHTALTLMAEAGVPIEVRRWIAGHSKTEQTAHYSHESWTQMQEAVDRLGRAVG
jgi:integrase